MGRNGQPVEVLQFTGKKHLTKQEIESRRKSEIKFGDKKLSCPAYVKSDEQAYKKWKEVIDLYKNVEFIASGDAGLLARYCKTYSEYLDMLKSYQRIKEIHYDSEDLDEAINGSYTDEDDENKDKQLFSGKVKKQLRDMISIYAILNIEAAINKKMDMLIKMEDRMFLNPLAKVKNVPKKEESQPESKWDSYK